jgi:LmeA-like phospholipid-binding
MRRAIALAAPPGIVLGLLGVAQLVLPSVAADRPRARLSRSGQVIEVRVAAFPAIELLWHRADSVVVRLARYRAGPSELAGLLGQTGDVGSIDASVGELDAGLLTLRDVTVNKRGMELTGSAVVALADLQAALPLLKSVRPVASGGGRLTLRATVSVLGVGASVELTLQAQAGTLVLTPNLPLGGLGTITVFASPRVYVQDVGGSPVAGGFSAFVRARLQ